MTLTLFWLLPIHLIEKQTGALFAYFEISKVETFWNILEATTNDPLRCMKCRMKILFHSCHMVRKILFSSRGQNNIICVSCLFFHDIQTWVSARIACPLHRISTSTRKLPLSGFYILLSFQFAFCECTAVSVFSFLPREPILTLLFHFHTVIITIFLNFYPFILGLDEEVDSSSKKKKTEKILEKNLILKSTKRLHDYRKIKLCIDFKQISN